MGTRNLGDILSEREAIASEMQQGLDSATAPWGVLVERVEVEWISFDVSCFRFSGCSLFFVYLFATATYYLSKRVLVGLHFSDGNSLERVVDLRSC